MGATNNPKMGRPIKNIDKEKFEELCILKCARREISIFFAISDKMLEKWCHRTYEKTFSEVRSDVIWRKKVRGNGKIRQA